MAKFVCRGVLAALVCVLIVAGPALAARSRPAAQPAEGGLLDELNFARTRPADYATVLLEEAGSSRSAHSSFMYEDPRALDEAVDFLLRQAPLPALRSNSRLGAAALAYAERQGRQGGFGHGGPGASLSERMQSHGVWASLMAEDISYGYTRPRDVVRQLIVDSGVPGRGHRNNIFGRSFQAVGIGCGPHRLYGAMCVVDFAGGLGRG
jgi:hypothetical protein